MRSTLLLRIAAAGLALGWPWLRATEEPAGGSGREANPTPAGAAEQKQEPASLKRAIYDGKVLPWPKPAAGKVAKLEKELKGQLPQEDFRFLTVGPWVIATDLGEEEAQRFAASTMATYASRIQTQLFTKQPRSEPVKVYLFKDADSYTLWNVKLFKERPTTPYGYYSRVKNALVMNIGTGGGTLLHEMVHAMAEEDFPAIPSWLNEGLGSLFEASMAQRDGKVAGFTNWRLTGLQRDIRNGTATKLADLVKFTTDEFYGARSGANYASARYLMQYLQDNGKLEAFYTRIRDGKDADAAASLRAVFDDKLSVEEIEKAVYAWALTLKLR